MLKLKKIKTKISIINKQFELAKSIQNSKILRVIGNKEFLELYHELKELKKYVSFKNKKILDIGCGSGNFLILYTLFESPLFCVGLDPAEGHGSDENVIHIFRDNVEKLNIKKIDIIRKDIWDFDTKDIKFDVIIANFSLHHIIETKENLLKSAGSRPRKLCHKLFLKISNLLEDNGVFIIKEASKYNLARYWQFYGKLVGSGNINWKTKHIPNEYLEILRECEFHKNMKMFIVPYKFNKFRNFLSNPLAGFFFGSTYFIISTKDLHSINNR